MSHGRWRRVLMVLCLALVAGACAVPAAGTAVESSSAALNRELTVTHRMAVYPISLEVTRERLQGFVQVEITAVHNPDQVPVSFRVDYRDEAGRRTQLGVFGLYPPDNPGTFLVATGNNVEPGGEITVLLEPQVDVNEDTDIRVHVKRIRLIARELPQGGY